MKKEKKEEKKKELEVIDDKNAPRSDSTLK